MGRVVTCAARDCAAGTRGAGVRGVRGAAGALGAGRRAEKALGDLWWDLCVLCAGRVNGTRNKATWRPPGEAAIGGSLWGQSAGLTSSRTEEACTLKDGSGLPSGLWVL